MRAYTFATPSEAYIGLLEAVLTTPDYRAAPRGQMIFDTRDTMFEVLKPASTPIVTRDSDRNAKIVDYTQKEFELYNSGANDAESFTKISKFWGKIANPDGTINSAYGHLIFFKPSCGNSMETWFLANPEKVSKESYMRTPWVWARESLIRDKDSRQAIIRVSLPEHQWIGNADQVCTMHGTFSIRDNQLHLSMVMRSCDLVKGLVYDMPWFCHLQERMLTELRPTYSDLVMGTYTHMAHSLHIYERDLETVKRMIGHG